MSSLFDHSNLFDLWPSSFLVLECIIFFLNPTVSPIHIGVKVGDLDIQGRVANRLGRVDKAYLQVEVQPISYLFLKWVK